MAERDVPIAPPEQKDRGSPNATIQ